MLWWNIYSVGCLRTPWATFPAVSTFLRKIEPATCLGMVGSGLKGVRFTEQWTQRSFSLFPFHTRTFLAFKQHPCTSCHRTVLVWETRDLSSRHFHEMPSKSIFFFFAHYKLPIWQTHVYFCIKHESFRW